MEQLTEMQAPDGVRGECTIEGHQYKIPKDGVIKVISPDHIETLKRHGFIPHLNVKDAATKIDEATEDDKAWLVQFIEERGEDADDSMKLKKLKRLAREVNEKE